MGFRFAKRITLLPGVRLNVSGSGLGLTLGPRGASVSIGRNGIYGNAGIPGTGLSYRTKLSGGSSDSRARSSGSRNGGDDPIGNITISIADDGTLTFRDEIGADLTPAQARRFKAENAVQIEQLLENAAASMNEDREACLNIFRSTAPLGARIPPPAEFDGRFKPQQPEPEKLGLLDKLLGRATKIDEQNQNCQSAYQAALAEWQSEFAQFNDSRERVVKAMTLVAANDVKAMEVVADYLLNRITWPRVTNISFGVSECGRVIGIDLDLPDEDEVPTMSATVGRGRLTIKKSTDTQLNRDFSTLAYGSVFRVAGDLFAGLPTIKKVVISSYLQRTCQGTGGQKDEYVMSSIIDREEWSKINFDQLEFIQPAAAIGMFNIRVKTDRTLRFQEITPFEITDSYS